MEVLPHGVHGQVAPRLVVPESDIRNVVVPTPLLPMVETTAMVIQSSLRHVTQTDAQLMEVSQPGVNGLYATPRAVTRA